MKGLAGQAFTNWRKLGRVNHPGWSILNQAAYEAIVPRNAEQFAELQTTYVSGHNEVSFCCSEAVHMPMFCLLPRQLHAHLLQQAAGIKLWREVHIVFHAHMLM